MERLLIPPSPDFLKPAMNDQIAGMLCLQVNEPSKEDVDFGSLKKSSKHADGEIIYLPSSSNTSPDVRVARFYCKARGVPDLHNPRNAVIDVPLDVVVHGEILICSHATCSSSGRRFRYCTVCRCPVAKRNFIKRHGHGIVKPKRRSASYVSDSDSSSEDHVPRRDRKRSRSEAALDPLNLMAPPIVEAPRLAQNEDDWLDSQSRLVSSSVNQDELSIWLKGIMDPTEVDSTFNPLMITSADEFAGSGLFAV